MNILYIGDIMGAPGVEVVRQVLPQLKREYAIDLVVAQSENVTAGRGINKADYQTLRSIGIDAFTGGNWSLHQPDMTDYMNDPQQPIVRPANYPEGTQGRGWKVVQSSKGPVLIISLLGQIVGKDADKPVDNPLHCIDAILGETKAVPKVATIINFHGDYSSEKRVIGYYLDGSVTAVIGDHWHVPTADAMVLPNGTAHITDVGMCGSLHSSLGVKLDVITARWRDDKHQLNQLETEGPRQFNAVLITSDDKTSLATKIEQIQRQV